MSFEPNIKSSLSENNEVVLFYSQKTQKIKENLRNRFMENYRKEITHQRLDDVLKVILSNNY